MRSGSAEPAGPAIMITMWRSKNLTVSAVTVAALAVLFAVFIGFRHDAALIGALSAAGSPPA